MDIPEPGEILNSILSWWVRKRLKIFSLNTGFLPPIKSFPLAINPDVCSITGSVSKVAVFDALKKIADTDVSHISMDFGSVEVSRVGDTLSFMEEVRVYNFLPYFTVPVSEKRDIVDRLPLRRYNLLESMKGRAFWVVKWMVANRLGVNIEDIEIKAVFGSIPMGWVKGVVMNGERDVLFISISNRRVREDVCGKLVVYEMSGRREFLFIKE